MNGRIRDLDKDFNLVRSVLGGDVDAFKKIYERHKNSVFNVALRITGSYPDALDTTQEIFLTVYEKLYKFKFKSKFSSWIYRIAVNRSIDKRRKLNLENVTLLNESIESINHKELVAENLDSKKNFSPHIQNLINKLSPKLSSIIVLRYIEELSYSEIAEVLKCSEGTVKSRLSRAHAKVRELMEEMKSMNL